MISITNYLSSVNRLFQTGNAREHSYRGDLQHLLNEIINDKDIVVTNEPARIREVGAPDYSITKKDIPIGYIEAKDIDKPLDSKEYKEQFERYKNALDNLIITDYLDFWFYRNGELVEKIQIAKIEEGKIVASEKNFSLFTNNILNFTAHVSRSITSPIKLAKLMAGKARLLENVIEKAILSDEESDANNSLRNEMKIFKANLIHDITPSSFADIYAQTIAYGMFAARLHDTTLEDFSRQEAQYLIPKSNPFLRGLFSYISGADCDDRLVWIIDSLAEVFLATDVAKILEGFFQKSGMNDPIIHFYETFLAEYNPALRKSRGVWYTPEAVVNFIVRACDEVLKDEFGLPEGLTDDTKIKISIDDLDAGRTTGGKLRQKEKEVHKVQILDPATGTGTFLAETIKFIKKDFFGSWSSYVENDLIPRLNGFELLMASYAMAHLKLDLLLMETGYKPINQKRFNVFLTNSLEEHHEQAGTLFSSYLANESKEADRVKKETPVMVVMGNPPYSVSSSNKSEWIQRLVQDYKKDLNERNIQPLSDDYIKFIRYGQHYIEKNGEGILAYISNNSFIDGIIHRQMRKSLLECFDTIYILDLHGNSKKKEVCPDGSKDENVFDIMQGVSINIFIKKKSKSKKLADVFHSDLQGKRDFKYDFLSANSLKSIKWNKLDYSEPNYFFVPKNFDDKNGYMNSFSSTEIFKINSVGVVTSLDKVVLADTLQNLQEQISDYGEIYDEQFVKKYLYRPFENKYIYYKPELLGRPREKIMRNYFKNNIGLIISKQFGGHKHFITFITKIINDKSSQAFAPYYNHPLYIYPDKNSLETKRSPNLNLEIVAKIEKALNLKFVPEKEENKTTLAPIDILDYIYAVLHSPNYRETYKEFLKIDFPRVPFPEIKTFWQLVEMGGKLRALHLLEDESLNERIIEIDDGNPLITNKLNQKDFIVANEKVTLQISPEVAISNIPLIAWEFYIGGYQPAQKWLKDRVGRELSRSDLKHYNRIINALTKTDEIMKKIDTIFEV
jgi:predicted helicase